jgi:hypothetical protein
MPKKTTRLDKTRLPAKQSGLEGRSGTFKVARYVVYDDTIIAVRISTNDDDINNNYKIYITRSSPKPTGGRMEVVV